MFLDGELIGMLGKGIVLILIGLYAVFSLIITFQVRGLNQIIKVSSFSLSSVLPWLFVIHLLLVVSLFFLALAIL